MIETEHLTVSEMSDIFRRIDKRISHDTENFITIDVGVRAYGGTGFEMIRWLDQNTTGLISMSITYTIVQFKDPKEAVLFKLAWVK